MKIIIFGSHGQLGRALRNELGEHKLYSPPKTQCDITDNKKIKCYLENIKPDLIINAAAYTNVDQSEVNKEEAYAINTQAAINIAALAKSLNIYYFYFSTDYVFDGLKKEPYKESDITAPKNYYGFTKNEAEQQIIFTEGKNFIFRITWLYSDVRNNFFLTMLKMFQDKKKVYVVDDQIGCPTSTLFVAKNIKFIIKKLNNALPGIYHLVPNGSTSWYGFAKEIYIQNISKDHESFLFKKKSKDLNLLAERPMYSVLSNKKASSSFMIEFDDWRSVFKEFLNKS